jgi:hypothetical protein
MSYRLLLICIATMSTPTACSSTRGLPPDGSGDRSEALDAVQRNPSETRGTEIRSLCDGNRSGTADCESGTAEDRFRSPHLDTFEIDHVSSDLSLDLVQVCQLVHCGSLGQECGLVQDDCHRTVDCGKCPQGQNCLNGVCVSGMCVPTVTAYLSGLTTDIEVGDSDLFLLMGTSVRTLRALDGPTPMWSATAALPPWPRASVFHNAALFVLSTGRSPVECGDVGQCARLHIFDTSNDAKLLLLGESQWPTPGTKDGFLNDRLILNGPAAYIMQWGQALYVVDVSDPSNPKMLLGDVSPPGTGFATDMVLDSGHLLVADANDGIVVHDVASPLAPVLKGNIPSPTGQAVTRMVATGSSILMVDTHGTGVFVDVAEPLAPTIVAEMQIHDGPSCQISDVSTAGTSVYISGCCLGFEPPGYVKQIAVLQPDSPEVVSFLTLDYCPLLGLGTESLLVSSQVGQVTAFDLSSPTDPLPLWTTQFIGSVWDLAVDGIFAYAAAASQGLLVFDISDPAAPIPVATVKTAGSADRVAFKNASALVTSKDTKQPEQAEYYLSAFDVSEAASPGKLWEQLLPGNVRHLHAFQESIILMNQEANGADWRFMRAHLGDSELPLQEFGPLFARNPTGMDSAGFSLVVAWSGDAAWPGTPEHGFTLLKANADGSLNLVSEYSSTGLPSVPGIVVAGNRVYLAGAGENMGGGKGNELHIVDISSPETPFLQNVVPVGYSSISVHEDLVFLSDKENGGFAIFDMAEAASPETFLDTELFFDSLRLHVESGYAFLTGGPLAVLDVRGCWGGGLDTR